MGVSWILCGLLWFGLIVQVLVIGAELLQVDEVVTEFMLRHSRHNHYLELRKVVGHTEHALDMHFSLRRWDISKGLTECLD